MSTATYRTRPIKRSRRTKSEIGSLKTAIYNICWKHKPLTVRQLFYRMVVALLIAKTQLEYKNVTVRLAGEMREAGDLPWDWLVDETRWMRKPKSYDSLPEALREMQEHYRRDFWKKQDVYAEVWCESGSASGIVYPVTAKWDAPLMPSHGFSSKAFCWNTAKTIEHIDKPTYIFYVGDYDPSGVHIDRDIEAKLHRYAPDADITFKRIAVLPEQIEAWNLPSAPPKKSDSRSKSFDGRAVEVEAIEPSTLRQLVDDELMSLVDQDAYRRMLIVEEAERDTLAAVISSWGDGDDE
jgi:hypothetical protein